MRRLTVLVLLFGLALVFQGCKPADACEGLFSGFFGGSSGGCGQGGYGGSYTPVYDGGCGSYSSYDPCGGYASYDSYDGCGSYSTPIQSSGGCCPETQPRVIRQTRVDLQLAPVPDSKTDLVPQEPDPKMTPVESQDGPEMLPPAILETDGTISLVVPAEAIVYINGYRTRKTGTKRTYRSQNLRAGYNYQYNIIVQVGSTQKAGVVTLKAGERKLHAYHQFHPHQLLARK